MVTQGSNRGVIDWRSFSIGANEAVRFDQPGRSAVSLNRVTGTDISRIDGNLSANGQVWLSNPNGVMIGQSGQVNVSGLLATTGRIDSSEFFRTGRAAIDQISRNAAIVNGGTINIAAGGYAALAAASIRNEGVIAARTGTVALGAGKAMTVDFAGDKLITFQVTQPLAEASPDADAALVNTGTLTASGGIVQLSARAAKGVMDNVINLKGHVVASSVRVDGGTVTFGDGGTVQVSAKIDASSASAKGGDVTVLGEKVGVMDGADIDASGATGGGTVLIGGDWQGKGAIGAAGQNAQIAYVGTSARITVDATKSGDGGKAVIWADDTTRFSGAISARGGALSGDGGQVETSGKRTLDVATSATVTTASRAGGKPGAWLLDPTDITIAAGGGGAIAGGIFNPAASSTIDPAVISAALNNGNVTIQTSAGSGGNGDINFVSGTITTASATARTLALRADRSISMTDGASISLAGAAHNIIFNSGASATSQTAVAGNISILGRIRIETTSGSISLVGGKGGAFAAQGIDSATNATGIFVGGGAILTAGDGSITIRGAGGQLGTNGVCVCGAELGTTGRGSIAITGARGNFGFTSNVSIQGSLIQTIDGAININGTSNIGGGNQQNTGVYLYSAFLTTKNGRISISGTGSDAEVARFANNDGIVSQASTLTATGSGSIFVTGIRGRGLSTNMNLYRSDISTVTGGITINGTASTNGTRAGSHGVVLDVVILKTQDGLISISGVGGADSEGASGVVSSSGANLSATGKGTITVTGVRGGAYGRNLSLLGFALSTNTGDISLIGTATYGGAVSSNVGVYGAVSLTTVNGRISVSGAGGRATGSLSLGSGNDGISLYSSVFRATGTGSITIAGVRGDGVNSSNVQISGSAFETVGGAITLNGANTSGGGVYGSYGLSLRGTTVGTNFGKITLNGASALGTGAVDIYMPSFRAVTTGIRTPGKGSLVINGSIGVADTWLTIAGSTVINGAVDLPQTDSGGLTIMGSAVTFNGAIGAIRPIHTFTAIGAAATTYLGGNVTTVGSQSYGGKLVLNNDITMTTGNGDISVFGTVNSGGTAARSLSVLVGGVDSSAIFAGDIGGVRALKDVLINTNGKGVTLPSLRAANLTVNTHGGFIDQSGTLKISEQASFTAGANYIALNTSGANDFNVLKVSADGDVLVTDGVGGLVLGQSGVGGTLTLSARGTVSQTGVISASGVLMLGASADYLLTDIGNRIASVAANAGSVNLASGGDLTVALVNGTVGITTARNATLTALEGQKLTLNAKVTAGTASLAGNTLSGAGLITAADLTLAAPGGGAITAKVNGATGAAAAALTKVTAGTVLVNGVPVSAP